MLDGNGWQRMARCQRIILRLMDTVSDRRPPLAWIVFITCYPRRILTCWPQLLPQGWLTAWIRPLSIVTQAKPHSLRYDHLSPWKTEPQTSDALSSSWAGKNNTTSFPAGSHFHQAIKQAITHLKHTLHLT